MTSSESLVRARGCGRSVVSVQMGAWTCAMHACYSISRKNSMVERKASTKMSTSSGVL